MRAVFFVAFFTDFFAAFFAVFFAAFFAAFLTACFVVFFVVFFVAFLAVFLAAFFAADFVAFFAAFFVARLRPVARSWPALCLTSPEAFLLGLAWTPSRRALDRPIAMACCLLLARPSPASNSSISSRTYSPAWVLGDLPARLSSCAALCADLLLGMEDSRCIWSSTYRAAPVKVACVSP
ncbi:hypothetical protein EA656_04455 [Pseudoxanthomonas winnipegensis]|uniref:Uncharacterized protein n=1 Tax=Pseudoxanthomonas winnipegensis TaxID=2480810 RepID=A0A4Q8LZH3_9GAMM|nr:hypothetical protein EA663_08335 [Pseudoxanthomonas winnipegensis]TAA37906.1 hypothetical protein EA656_04455 [Pseudoxanthomonas winnipegensis]